MSKKHNTFPRVVVPVDETTAQPFETQDETFADEVQEGLEIAAEVEVAASIAADAGVTVAEVASPGPPKPSYEVMLALVKSLEEKVAARSTSKPVNHTANSSARYKLSATIPDWDGARQVGSLMRILHATGKTELTEPEIFAAVKAGAEAKVLSTRQDPVHIFQYYRKTLKRNGFCTKI